MGTKYSNAAISGYNANPPPDDGSTTAANQVAWAKHLAKIGDPVKTLAETINTKLVTALDQSARSVTASDSAIAADHNRTIQIASTTSPAVTITLSDATTMAAGYIVTVFNLSAYTATVARSGSDTINGAPSVTIPSGFSTTFIVNAAANGYLTKSGYVSSATDSNAGILEIATQAEQETATAIDKIVTPGRQVYNPSAAKGWAIIQADGTVTGGFNVASTTDAGAGDMAVNWGTPFSSASYAPYGGVRSDVSLIANITNTNTNAGTTRVITRDVAGTPTDPNHFIVIAFGDW